MATATANGTGQAMRDMWAVRRYLDSLESTPARREDPDTLRARLDAITAELAGTDDILERLALTQRRIDTEEALTAATSEEESGDLEGDFVAVAARYSERRGITWTAWREVGVPAAVLRTAGVPRTRYNH